jgi:hypothetical protein
MGPTDGRWMPKMSQEALAEIVGTTRSRVNVFMNKFRDLGFIEYTGKTHREQLPAHRRLARLARHPPPVHLETARHRRCPYSGSQENR